MTDDGLDRAVVPEEGSTVNAPTWQDPPSAETLEAIRTVAERCTAHDGVAPFSEATVLALGRMASGSADHGLRVLVDASAVNGAALLADDGSAEVAVLPAARGRGHGGRLLDALLEAEPTVSIWAHGDLPAAQGAARSRGLTVGRNLWRMERRTDAEPVIAAPRIPEGFAARTFVPGQDEQAWLDLNATAFAHHPEQGRMTLDDLRERMAQPWFEAAGLLLIEDRREAHPRLVASHWTKVAEPDVGEVYVVAVDPVYQGQGLGKAVTALGLHHLAAREVPTIELYVEGDNAPAVATYTGWGFARASVDVMYSRAVHEILTP